MVKHTKLGGIVTIFATILLIAGFAAFSQQALADAKASNSTAVDISVTKSGDTNGADAYLEKDSYNTGETVVLKWKGGVDGDDFVAPTQITYNSTTYNISDLIKIDELQTANEQYQRRMGSAGTMTTFTNVQNYLATTQSLSLGSAISGSISVTFSKVAPVYRLYNMLTSEHLFTTQKAEYDNFVELCETDSDAWIGEGISWFAPKEGAGTSQVYRLYNAGLGALGHSSHYYTSDLTEKANLENNSGWTDDGTVNGFLSGGSTAIYTCYNEALGSAHHYTSSKSEWQGLDQHGWALEQDKNGTNPTKNPEGVFQCSLATSWSFDTNYYKVYHKLDGVTASVQYVSGQAGATTNAVAKDIPGYNKPTTIAQQTILAGNTTTVDVNYTTAEYTITYDMKDYGASTIEPTRANYGARVSAPTEPNDETHDFGGWFYDYDCKYPVDWSDRMPATNMTVYAQWTAKPLADVHVTFDLGEHGAAAIDSQTFKTGNKATKPAEDPVSTDGYVFDGWYSDSTLNTPVNWDAEITSDVTYYAKWKQASVTITFDADGGTPAPESQVIDKGSALTLVPEVSKDGYLFDGWFKEDGTTRVDATTTFDTDTKLTARWTGAVVYTVDVYQMGTDGNYAEEATSSTEAHGFAGDATEYEKYVTVEAGFYIDTEKSQNETISADGTTRASVYLARNKVTVKYVSNAARNSSEQDGTVRTLFTQTALVGGKLTSPDTSDLKATGRAFDTWLKSGFFVDEENTDGTTPNIVWDFDKDVVPALDDGAELTLYAKWKSLEVWISHAKTITTDNTAEKANQANPKYPGNPETEIIRTAQQIEHDVEVLRTKNESDPEYTTVKNLYESWMNSDEYHLYTLWGDGSDTYSTADSSGTEQEENRYLEFRIIQVGSHQNVNAETGETEDDGSVLTFQMTHTAPTSFYIVDPESEVTDDQLTGTEGWENSQLRTRIQFLGSIYEKMLGADTLKEISKQTFKGSSTSETVKTQDKLWIASFYEMFPDLSSSTSYEGSSYQWFNNMSTKVSALNGMFGKGNPALIKKTRAGNYPLGDNTSGGYWTRTPSRTGSSQQLQINSEGYGLVKNTASQISASQKTRAGVVVCFAF